MRQLIPILIVFVCITMLPAGGQTMTFPSSVALTDNALAIPVNPAALGYRTELQALVLFPYRNDAFTREAQAFFMMGNLGLGGEWLNSGETFYQRWQFASGAPVWKWLNLGATYRWCGTVSDQSEWDLGLMARPRQWLSLGAVYRNLSGRNQNPEHFQAGLALRPLGERFTIGADFFCDPAQPASGSGTQFIVELTPVKGLTLSAAWNSATDVTMLGLNLQTALGGYLGGADTRFNSGVAGGHVSSAIYPTVFKKRSQIIVRYALNSPIQEAPAPFRRNNSLALIDVLKDFDDIRANPEIKGVLLQLDGLVAGISKLSEIRQALLALRESGKQVVCLTEYYSMGQYYLASACDRVYLTPAGMFLATGISGTALYFRGLLDKIGIEPEFERVGQYKTAP